MSNMLSKLHPALRLFQAAPDQEGRDREEPGSEELGREREATDNALRMLAPVQPPDQLALQIRLALSHERVRQERRLMGRLAHRWEVFRENSLRPFAVQAAVAVVALVSVAGGALLLGAVAPQQAVEANDIPLAGFSSPRYLYSVAGEQPVGGSSDKPLIVEAKIDRSGRVYDYRVVSGDLNTSAASALQQRMLTGVFRPAKIFGEAVRGTILLTFSDVAVRG